MSSLGRYFQERWLEIAVIGVGLPLFVLAVGELVHRPGLLFLLTAAFFVLVVLVSWLTERRNRPTIGGAKEWEHVRGRDGVILTLGLKSHEDGSTVLKVLREARPRVAAFVGTKATAAAKIGETVARKAGLNEGAWCERTVNPTDVDDVRANVHHLIGWVEGKGVARSRLLVDLTGGMAVASVGAYIAAADTKVDTIYVVSDYQDNKPVEGSQRVLPISSYSQ